MQKPATNWKEHIYFTGRHIASLQILQREEVAYAKRHWLVFSLFGIVLVIVGGLLGLALAPATPREIQAHLLTLQQQYEKVKIRNDELERALRYRETSTKTAPSGSLPQEVKKKHIFYGAKMASILRQAHAQPASELMEWFTTQWNALLDLPRPDDRVDRRAETLSLLVGGMGENLSEDAYMRWQYSFFNPQEPWLAELHLDRDGDKLPRTRNQENPRDGFVNQSVCVIAMSLNQAITDAHVLMMRDMHCDRPEARMSIFLQGSTLNDALNEFVAAVRREGFLVVERQSNGVRSVLVGSGTRKATRY